MNTKISLRRLPEVDPADIIVLHNHPLVRRQMPLFDGEFTRDDVPGFVDGKEEIWSEHGYGPWAFYIGDAFAGWGGMQPEGDDVDLALVLHPDFWGWGRAIYEVLIDKAFGEMGFESLTILFPISRTRVKGVIRLGFVPDGEVLFGDEVFIRYRLDRPGGEPG